MQKDLDSVVLTQSAWAETKHSMDPASVQQLLQGRIRQLQLPVPDSQPELLQKPETFEEYMRMMTRNPEMTPVRRAMRAALKKTPEADVMLIALTKKRGISWLY
jgi:hypothetical protein